MRKLVERGSCCAFGTHLNGVAVLLRCSMNLSILSTRSAREVELAATEHFAGEDREERFDLVQPRRVHWRVVDHEAGMLTQPLLFTFERCELPLSITTCIDNDESIDSSIWPRNSMK